MLDWRQLCGLSDAELAKQDIAGMNLACAADLPGAEHIDFDGCIRIIDDWTQYVEQFTKKMEPRFAWRPEEFEHSRAYFQALCLVTALQRDLGVRYNPAKIPDESKFDTADSFIFGLVQGQGGTCATLPVVYSAVGRKLGYPLKLVRAHGGEKADHLFARWDEPPLARFNIEASGQGLSCPPDDYYRQGRYSLTPTIERAGGYLQSQTSAMDLSDFVMQRAIILKEHRRLREAAEATAFALGLRPDNVLIGNSLRSTLSEWEQELGTRRPKGFPMMRVGIAERRFPAGLPMDLEAVFCGHEAMQNLLDDKEADGSFWEPMRRMQPPQRLPKTITVLSTRQGTKVSLELEVRR